MWRPAADGHGLRGRGEAGLTRRNPTTKQKHEGTMELQTVEPANRDARDDDRERGDEPDAREMPCPVCGAPMPDLKGGKATICPVCGFKDSCCY